MVGEDATNSGQPSHPLHPDDLHMIVPTGGKLVPLGPWERVHDVSDHLLHGFGSVKATKLEDASLHAHEVLDD